MTVPPATTPAHRGGQVPTQRRLKPYYYVVAGVLLQGLSPVLTKLLLNDGLSREAVVSARYLLAALLLVPFGLPRMGRQKPAGPPRRRDYVALFLVGVLGSGVGALLFTAALEYSSAGIVNSISKTAPIFVAFFGYLTLRERVSYGRLLLVGAMVGADALIGLGELSFSAPEARLRLLGDGLALLAGLTRATAEILAKGALARFSASTVTFWRFGAGFLVTGTVAGVTGSYTDLLHLAPRSLLLLGLLAGVSTALSMYLYYKGTASIAVHVAVSLKILGAIVTAIVSWIVLQETLNLYHVAGMGVLISGGYLLVIRAARETPSQEAPVAAPASTPRETAGTGRLRVRLMALIAGTIIVTVLVASALSVRHTNTMVKRQIRLTMGKVAAVLVQLTGLEEPPNRHTLQQYIERVVRHRITDEVYSVDIVYIAVLDANDNLLAFAVNDQVTLVDENGETYRADDARAGRQLLAMSERGELGGRYDLIPVRAELGDPGRPGSPAGFVEIGCKRSIANRVLAEIAARNILLGLLLVSLGIALAAGWVRRITNPLERIALAMQRLSGGDLDLPLYSEGRGEVREMGDSLQNLRDSLRMGGALRQALVRYGARRLGRDLLAANGVAESAEVRDVALLFVKAPPQLVSEAGDDGNGLAELVQTVVAGVLQNDGEIAGYLRGCVVAYWAEGGEEDALWAALTALDLRDALRGRPVGEGLLLAVEAVPMHVGLYGLRDQELREVHSGIMVESAETPPGPGVVAGPGAMAMIGEHVRATELPDGRWWLEGAADDVVGFAEIADAGDE